MPPSATKSGTQKLSDVAKHLAAPTGIVSTGWPAVRKTCVEKLGVPFDDWQDNAGRLILAKRADGCLAAMIDGVGLSLPRQVGKTYLIGAMIFALCVNTPGLLVIWSAHHARTHAETFLVMQGFAGRSRVEPYVRQVYTGSGDEEVRFHNESRILFGARERGFGRGIPGVDILIFDEAQILSDRALSNMLATMNTSSLGLALYIGTPPKPEDNSESFQRMRNEALAGTLVDGVWIEFGADEGASPGDRSQWKKANPSYPLRTPVQSILRLKRKLTEADFLREGMGVWSEEDLSNAALSPKAWEALTDAESRLLTVKAFAIDTTPDLSSTSIVAAGPQAGHLVAPGIHVEVVRNGRGLEWALAEAVALDGKHGPAEWVIDSVGPASALIDDFIAAGLNVRVMKSADVGRAFTDLRDAVEHATIVHGPDEALRAAVKGAKRRPLGDGGSTIGRKASSTVDISGLVAVELAHWAVRNPGEDKSPVNNVW